MIQRDGWSVVLNVEVLRPVAAVFIYSLFIRVAVLASDTDIE